MKRIRKAILPAALLLASLFFFSCAHTEAIDACLTGRSYGFFSGLLHGFITPISFIGGLFNPDVAIYAVHNSGSWYDFGFLLGSSGWGFMAGNRSKR